MTDLSPEKFISLPRKEAEKAFNTMTIERQAMTVLMAPWEKRQEIMLLSKNFPELVQSMPVEELFWTIKATGPEDSLLTIAACSCQQLQFIFDLDWWERDEFRLDRIAAWLILLLEAGEKQAGTWLAWIMRKDPYLLPAAMRNFLKVQKRPDDMDIEEAKHTLYPFTIDNSYYIEFSNEKLEPLWNRLIMKLLELDPGFYRDCMETILTETSAECTEHAWKHRCGRLADFGIPDYFTALDIYAPIPPQKARTARSAPVTASTEDQEMPAFVPTLYMMEFPALSTGIERLADSSHIARIIREWTGVANKIIMADRTDLDDPDAMKFGLEKTAAMINLGIEVMSRELPSSSAHEILISTPLEDLVRVAMWPLAAIRARARKIASKVEAGMLPPAYTEQFSCLTQPVPSLWDSEGQTRQPFARLDQTTRVEEMVGRIETWLKMMEHLKPHWSRWKELIAWEQTNFLTPSEFTWQQGLATAIANYLLDGTAVITPVHKAGLERLPALLESDMLNETLQRAAGEISQIAGIDENDALSVLEEASAPIKEEILPHAGKDTTPDPRYITSILTDLRAVSGSEAGNDIA